MKTYNNLYSKLCSIENLQLAYQKASKGKSQRPSIKNFEEHLEENLQQLQHELQTFTYTPRAYKRFIVRDPKTRIINAADVRDRVVHHGLINIIGPIFENRFIYDSFANQIGKGTHAAVQRFKEFQRKVSNNGKLLHKAFDDNHVQGYVLKADVKHYFDTVDHALLLDILNEKIADQNVLWLIQQILQNFETSPGKGMPLGNLTSQFFANVYLTKLDYFVKHKLKAKYYIRYVDDFVVLHHDPKILDQYKRKIELYLKNLHLELHPTKTKITSLRSPTTFLGYRIFYHYKLLRKRNLKKFEQKLTNVLESFNCSEMSEAVIKNKITGWFGYAEFANTYHFRKRILRRIQHAIRK